MQRELARNPVDGVALRQASDPARGICRTNARPDLVARDPTGALELGQLRDAPRVPLLARERLGDEGVDEVLRLLDGVLPGANRDEVSVVVLPSQNGRGHAPYESGTSALHLVGRDLLAVARTAENDSQTLDPGRLVGDDPERGVDAETGVVVERVVARRPMVDNFVTCRPEVLLEVLAELQTGMIGRDVDAHDDQCRRRTGAGLSRSAGGELTQSTHVIGDIMSTIPTVMPILSAGRHRSPRRGACFMEFASYLAGERWSDHPACTHPLLAALARDVNDLTSTQARNDLVPLIHRVVGLTSDDPLVVATIAMRAAAAALPVASLERQRALAVGMLNLLDTISTPHLLSMSRTAFTDAPDSERWARRYLVKRVAHSGFTGKAAEAMVHTAAVGIALACISDADTRLTALLIAAIDDTESLVRVTPSGSRELVSA